jgi:hypothetical protein
VDELGTGDLAACFREPPPFGPVKWTTAIARTPVFENSQPPTSGAFPNQERSIIRDHRQEEDEVVADDQLGRDGGHDATIRPVITITMSVVATSTT